MSTTELIKQLKIKTSILKRLKKQYESYDKETVNIKQKIITFETEQFAQPNEDREIQIKKNKEFLNQSQSVLSNVKQKLIEAFEGLTNYLSEKGEVEGVIQSEEKQNAENLVLEVQTFLENLA